MRLSAFEILPAAPIPLEAPDRAAFVDAWRQLHHLSQAVVEVGKGWGAPRADDSHSAMTAAGGPLDETCFVSSARERSLTGAMTDARVEVAHTPEKGPTEVALLDFDGLTVAEVRHWVRSQAERFAGPARQPADPAPDLPDHPVADGALLAWSPAMPMILAHYAATRDLLMRFASATVMSAVDGAHDLTPRLWPHHFDLAALYVARRDDAGEMKATIGVGLSPPDDTSADGYWYVSPWVQDAPARAFSRDTLPIGAWTDRETPMAVLPISAIWELAEREGAPADGVECAQACAISEFVASAFNACAAHLANE